jgi:hypothetical protein
LFANLLQVFLFFGFFFPLVLQGTRLQVHTLSLQTVN